MYIRPSSSFVRSSGALWVHVGEAATGAGGALPVSILPIAAAAAAAIPRHNVTRSRRATAVYHIDRCTNQIINTSSGGSTYESELGQNKATTADAPRNISRLYGFGIDIVLGRY
jgi:hypothetical protein